MTKRYPAWQVLVAGFVFLFVGAELIELGLREIFIPNSVVFAVAFSVAGAILVVVGTRYLIRGFRLAVQGPSPADVL